MKCSKCHQAIFPVVAVDIDGTLGNYHGHFLEFACQYLDSQFNMLYTGENELHEHMGISLEAYRDVKLAYRQGGGKRMMHLMPGAASLMTLLRSLNVEIWLTTTRPYLRLDSTDPDTRFWLQRHGLPFDHLLYHEDKYRVLAESVDPIRVVAVVDDLAEQLKWAGAFFGPAVPFQVCTPYNSLARVPSGTFSGTLLEARDFITKNVRSWRAKYDR